MSRETIRGIYVSGLGDNKPGGQDKLEALWGFLYGIRLVYHPVKWSTKEPFNKKLDRLTAHISELYLQHGKIALVGSSAGFSAVINAYADSPEKICAVIGYCGKIQNPETVSYSFDENPAFEESLNQVPMSIDKLSPDHRSRILSVKPLHDPVVPPEDTFIEGAEQATIHMRGHAASIAWGLTFGSLSAAKFIREQASQSS